MKNGFIVSCLILFKSTISVGMLNNQMYFFGSGWFLGIFISALITYLIGYGMVLVCEVAQDVEKKSKVIEIDTFEALAMYISKNERTQKIWYAVCKVFVFLFNQSVISVISINLSKFLCDLLKDNFDSDVFRDLRMYKLIVLVLLLLLVILILEPEKLKVRFLIVSTLPLLESACCSFVCCICGGRIYQMGSPTGRI